VPLSREQFSRSVLWLHLLVVRGFWLGFRREIRDLGATSAPRLSSELRAARGLAHRRPRRAAPAGYYHTSFEHFENHEKFVTFQTRAPPDTRRRPRPGVERPDAGDTDRHAEVVKVGRTTPNPANRPDPIGTTMIIAWIIVGTAVAPASTRPGPAPNGIRRTHASLIS